jgi:hypothetical protein
MGEDFPAALNLIEAIAQGARARNRDKAFYELIS